MGVFKASPSKASRVHTRKLIYTEKMELNKQTLQHRGQTPLQAALLHGAAHGGEGDGDLGLSGHAGQTGWGRGKPALEVHGLSKVYRLD